VISDVDFWIERLRLSRWDLYFYGTDRRHPDLIAAAFDWGLAVDVAVIHSENYSVVWRTPMFSREDNAFSPKRVTFWYAGPTNYALREILTLDEPQSHSGELVVAPPNCEIPKQYRSPLTFRPAAGPQVVMHTP
jgi:hypothetical protein